MADPFTDLLIYIGIGVITLTIGIILGSFLLRTYTYYTRRFMVIAKQCSDEDSLVPMVDERAKEA